MEERRHFPRSVIALWAAGTAAAVLSLALATDGPLERGLSYGAGAAILAGCVILLARAWRDDSHRLG
jgi:hypothetical protein